MNSDCSVKGFLARVVIAMLWILLSVTANASVVAQGVAEKLQLIREIKVTEDKVLLKTYNKNMDEAWSFFKSNKADVIPFLLEELVQERQKPAPNDLVLLDIGYFLYLEAKDDERIKEAAKKALYALNPKSEIVQNNFHQLFEFTRKIAMENDSQVLDLIDSAFLKNNEKKIFIPMHSMELGPTLQCVFLYGLFGKDAEEHLIRQLKNPALTNRVLEILIWIGTEKSFESVSAMLEVRDFNTFARSLGYMMEVAGPSGKSKMLGLNTDSMDEKSRQYFESVKNDIAAQSYPYLKAYFDKLGDSKKVSGVEMKKILSDMYDNYGKDDETTPSTILNSDLPASYLIEQLQRIRARMLFRLSDEAPNDVKITNALMNTLLYRVE